MSNQPKESAIAPGLRAIRDHLRPFLAIQFCVFLVVLAYYSLPGFQQWSASLAKIKLQGGLPFVFVSTALAGVALPEIFKRLTRDPRVLPWRELAFNALIFGFNGIVVDLFYRGQGLLFGTEPTLSNVVIKVAVDQLFGSPFIFCPYFLLLMLWFRSGFNLAALRENLRRRPFSQQLWPILVVNWAYWVPALCGIYAMPSDLQFVLFLFVEAAWSLILVHVTKRHA